MSVADIINKNNGSWDFSKIESICPEYILKKIVATHIPSKPTEDKPYWAYTQNGYFSIKSAYYWLFNKDNPFQNPNLPWDQIWTAKVCPRIKFFLWQAAHNGLPNSEFLHKRKIIEQSLCPLCKTETENIQHLFFSCPVFDPIRHKLPLTNNHCENFTLYFAQLNKQPDTGSMIATFFWLFWKARNEYVFQNKPINNHSIWMQKDLYKLPEEKRDKKKYVHQMDGSN